MEERYPEAKNLQYDASSQRFYWNNFRHTFLYAKESATDGWIVQTGFDALTEGLADLKPKWRSGMKGLRQTLPNQVEQISRQGRDKLVAPWDINHLQPAATLFAAYYKMLLKEGFFEIDKYRWYKRPARYKKLAGDA